MKISTKKCELLLYKFLFVQVYCARSFLSCSFSFAQELDKLQVESDALVYEEI